MKNLNHSKFKNAGILFECLVRQITVDTMENVKNSPAINIMKKYFNSNTELGKELQLYRAFFEMNPLSESKAVQFVDVVTNQRAKLNDKTLATEKFNLIKEVKQNYDLNSFLQVKIPNYKIYASIYKTFLAESKNFNISNIQDIASARFTLIEHLSKDKKPSKNLVSEGEIIDAFKNQAEDLRLLSYKLILDKFNEKYQNLNIKQKSLLREYINSVSNSNTFLEYIKSEIVPLKDEINKFTKNNSNKILNIKLNEVTAQLDKISNRKKVRDNELTAMMIAYQIVEELKS